METGSRSWGSLNFRNMHMLKRIWKTILGFFKKPEVEIPEVSLDLGPQYRFAKCEGHLPEQLEAETLYVLTEDGVPWEAAMICPSGCGERLQLNLLPDQRPRWRYSVTKDGIPSLHPSVNRKIGCRAHFILRQGRIIWATSY